MWSVVLLFSVFFVSLGKAEIFDVTTVYDVGNLCEFYSQKSSQNLLNLPEEEDINTVVFARTNALGLRFTDGENTYDSKIADQYNITCDFQDTCNWIVLSGKSGEDVDVHENYVYHINGTIEITFKRPPGNTVILFTQNNSLVRDSSVYYRVKFESDKVYLGKCNPDYNGYGHIDRDGTYFSTGCYEISNFKFNNLYFWFRFENSIVYIENHKHTTKEALTWKDDNYENMPAVDVKYFSMFDVSVDGPSIITKGVSGDNITVTSPLFTPVDNTLCLAVVFHSVSSSPDDELQVYVGDQFKVNSLLKTVRGTKAGLNYKLINESLPEGIASPLKITIKMFGKGNKVIKRIAPCNPEGVDVGIPAPLPSSDVLDTLHFPVFNVINYTSADSEWDTENPNKTCQNGGRATLAGCACPAGFAEPDCSQGCGRNRFGQDCTGVCSVYSKGCKGLLLCVPLVGCQCAPGYYGRDCNTQCSSGAYGSGCSETCGQCASDTTCDIYSGECSRCAPGYVYPYCKQAYVYYGSQPELSLPDYGQVMVSFNPTNLKGYGSPKLYQLQYRIKGEDWRIYTTKILPLNSTEIMSHFRSNEKQNYISECLVGLQHGLLYEFRVLFMDASFNKYTGGLVPTSQVVTKCDIPNVYNYNILTESNETSISFYWTYISEGEYWCPVTSYEVVWKGDWKWLSNITDGNITITDLHPGTEVLLKVRAVTMQGYAPFSETVRARTTYKSLSWVRDLHVVSSDSSAVKLSWYPPVNYDSGKALQYRVTYQCIDQPACSPGCHNTSLHELTVQDTKLTLGSLLPFSQYLVTVAPQDGPKVSIYAGTTEAVPTERPRLSLRTPLRTNISLTVFWEPSPVCSSFLLGYNYQLVKETGNEKIEASGFTKNTSVSIRNLTASTEYLVKVYIVTLAGWNPEAYLTIKTSTLGAVPDPVRNLTLYKQSRNMLGLRWAKPQSTYGQLKSFMVQHTLGHSEKSEIIEPTRCVPWPHLFCHTIDNLKANQRYNVTVRAQNTEVADYGEGISVSGITKEGSSSYPEELHSVNVSSTNVVLRWKYPKLANGIVRSFIISIEETETFIQERCCQVYPLVEIPVKEEKQFYITEVADLQPASTYYISVTAKTVVMGSSQSLVVHTQPPHLKVTELPVIQVGLDKERRWSWLPEKQLLTTEDDTLFRPLIKARLLLATLNETQPLIVFSQSGVSDPKLDSLLHTRIGAPFIFISEYKIQDETITIGNSVDVNDSDWGQPPSLPPLVVGQRYQMVVAQVTEYSGIYNVDLVYSTMFTYL